MDMYLRGKKVKAINWDQNITEDGFGVRSATHELAIGYWRKHHALHGFIVGAFGENYEAGEELVLTAEKLFRIMKAVDGGLLPYHSESGEDPCTQAVLDLKYLQSAIDWLKGGDPIYDRRTVFYKQTW